MRIGLEQQEKLKNFSFFVFTIDYYIQHVV